MKIAVCLLVAVALLSGCALPQISHQDIQDMQAAVQQAQQFYEQLKPVIEQLKPLAEQYLKDEEAGVLDCARGDRSSKWRAVRDKYAKEHPLCAFCGRETVDVHHIHPVHLFPMRELDPDNLVSLCRVHHFIYGHGGDWSGYNPDIMVDREIWKTLRSVKGFGE